MHLTAYLKRTPPGTIVIARQCDYMVGYKVVRPSWPFLVKYIRPRAHEERAGSPYHVRSGGACLPEIELFRVILGARDSYGAAIEEQGVEPPVVTLDGGMAFKRTRIRPVAGTLRVGLMPA